MRVLVVDDEKLIVKGIRFSLEQDGMEVSCAYDGEEALDIMDREEIHLVLLDIMMPKMDGITTMVRIRERSNVPVILLTAKSEDNDKILGLTIGADDYITKPFNPLEVSARVRSQLRRYRMLGANPEAEGTVTIGGIEMNDARKEGLVDGKTVNLTPKEYDILRLLMLSAGKVFSPDAIYRAVWQQEPYGSENTVAVHIRHLREKLEINPAEPRYIKVVFGQGYKLEKGRSL